MVMAVQTRGGVPRVQYYAAVPTAGIEIGFEALTNFLEIRNEGAEDLRVYFTEADFAAASDRFVPVAPLNMDDEPGVYVGPAEVRRLWLVAANNTTAARVISYFTR